ncbi:3-oxoacyl-ACP synthase III family protein [Streptomyces griseus]|uniref:3-oxoacyl-ACP synthase III family protein n=1 Tax=Streptomyces TaxID=1883 RepID=UPI0029C5C046|nr:3-oxoacyl-[acyl-carrier-protein] synthase III C-terminal domain-containing protein [Streptomyces sp. ID01-9D]MDX5575324.1 3-oxoacyl-[acyl-carrier-protein] synthase III C-terminal domain-containing protein [Streptomyces sp. ID01-9D]WSV22480.1 3-oxoacyl-ACP synthase [Streptomyces fimicarius]WTC88625.1 3-oxoacyl-ACP synthase [Streptomyces griseus]
MGGIVDFAVSFPSATADIHAMHRASGVPVADIARITHTESFPVLGDGEPAWELAVRAARTVLDRTAAPPHRVRQVLYAGSGAWDRPFWSPAAKVADRLGIGEAHCFEVANFCNAGAAALWLAAQNPALGPGEYALVLVGDRLSTMVDYADPASKGLFNFGDAAAAILLAADGDAATSFRVLHSAMRTDPSWSDYYHGESRNDRVVIRRGPHRSGLADAYVRTFTELVRQTLKELGRDIDDVGRLLINQGDRTMHERLLAELGIPASRSVFNYHRFGHMGGADPFIALRDLSDDGLLSSGELILLATSGMGFSWGITALEYQG